MAILLCSARVVWAAGTDNAHLRTWAEQQPLCRQVLTNHCIAITAEGQIPVPMTAVLYLLQQQDLLTTVQNEYRNMCVKQEPEFTIQQTQSNQYHYVNRKGQETDITEMLRSARDEETVNIVFYTCGDRFFGRFQSVILISAAAGAKDESGYSAWVYVYPENSFSRFFARHLGVVETFFRNKTGEIETIITGICNSIYQRSLLVADAR